MCSRIVSGFIQEHLSGKKNTLILSLHARKSIQDSASELRGMGRSAWRTRKTECWRLCASSVIASTVMTCHIMSIRSGRHFNPCWLPLASSYEVCEASTTFIWPLDALIACRSLWEARWVKSWAHTYSQIIQFL